MDLNEYTQSLEEYINHPGNDYWAPAHSWMTVEALAAYGYENNYKVSDIDDWEGEAEEAYAGQYPDDTYFARSVAEEMGSMPDEESAPWPMGFIDWERAAESLMQDYFEQGGYYFRTA